MIANQTPEEKAKQANLWSFAPAPVPEVSNLTEKPANAYVAEDWKTYFHDSATWKTMEFRWWATQPTQETTQTQPTISTQAWGITTAQWGRQANAPSVTAGRMNEMISNLNEWLANAPQLFSDFDTFKSAYWYEWKSPDERKVLEAFWQRQSAQTGSSQWIFQSLMANGWQIWNPKVKGTQAFKQAEWMYAKVQSLIHSTGNELLSAVDSWMLMEWSPEFNALSVANPMAVEQYKQLKANKRVAEDVNRYSKGVYQSANSVDTYDKGKKVEAQSRTPEPTPDYLQKQSDTLTKGTTPTYAEMWKKSISENPEIVNLSKTVSEIQWSINALNQEEIEMEDNIKAELAGTWAEQSYIDAKIRERLKPIYKQRNSLALQLWTAQNQLAYLTNNAKTELDLTIQQNREDQAKASEERQYAFQEAQAQKARDFQAQQFQLAQAYQNPDIDSQNPQIADIAARQAIQKQLDFAMTSGIPVTRDIWKILLDAKQYAQANWVSYSQAIQDTFTKPFQSKPEYQNAIRTQQNLLSGQMSDFQKIQAQQAFSSFENGIQRAYETNARIAQQAYEESKDIKQTKMELLKSGMRPADVETAMASITWEWQKVKWTGLLSVPDGTIVPTRLSEVTNPNNGKECAEYVNDVYNERIFPSSYEGKMAIATDKAPEVWGAVVFQFPGRLEKYGHVWIVVWLGETNGKKWMDVKSSNWDWDWKVTTERVAYDENSWLGFYNAKAKNLWNWGFALSNEAQRAVSSQYVSGTGKDRERTLNELHNAGVIDSGQGNTTFYTTPAKDKAEIADFISAADKFTEAKEIIEKHRKAWDLNEMLGMWDYNQERLKGKIEPGAIMTKHDEAFQKDFQKLNNILQQELSAYMKRISGAAVSGSEEKRLKEQIPSLSMSENEFDESVDLYQRSLDKNIEHLKTTYGFDTDESLRNKVIWEKIYKTDEWDYTEEQIKAEIKRALKEWTATPEKIEKWLKDNNIPYN